MYNVFVFGISNGKKNKVWTEKNIFEEINSQFSIKHKYTYLQKKLSKHQWDNLKENCDKTNHNESTEYKS